MKYDAMIHEQNSEKTKDLNLHLKELEQSSLFTCVIFKGVWDLEKWSVLWKWYFKFAFMHVDNNITMEHLLHVKCYLS